MSANENIQIAQKTYADFGRGDIAAVLNAVDENVEWVTPDIGQAPGGTYRGRAEVAKFFQQAKRGSSEPSSRGNTSRPETR
jgi:ketosteroid isomerase-like protein